MGWHGPQEAWLPAAIKNTDGWRKTSRDRATWRTSGALVSDLERLVFCSFLFLGFLLTQCYPWPLIVFPETAWLIVSWATQKQRLGMGQRERRGRGSTGTSSLREQLKQEVEKVRRRF